MLVQGITLPKIYYTHHNVSVTSWPLLSAPIARNLHKTLITLPSTKPVALNRIYTCIKLSYVFYLWVKFLLDCDKNLRHTYLNNSCVLFPTPASTSAIYEETQLWPKYGLNPLNPWDWWPTNFATASNTLVSHYHTNLPCTLQPLYGVVVVSYRNKPCNP